MAWASAREVFSINRSPGIPARQPLQQVSLRGLKPATDLRVKTGQGFDELKLLFPGFCGVFFDQTRCAGLAGFECGWF